MLRRPVEPGQYTSFRLAAHLAGENIAASIGTVGDALDNALMESTIGLYKTELIKRRGPWRTLTDVELGTAEWIDWYNNRRLHGEIGHVPPVEYEAEFYLSQPNLQLEPQRSSPARSRGAVHCLPPSIARGAAMGRNRRLWPSGGPKRWRR